jgi:UDP-glucose 4-epimerase
MKKVLLIGANGFLGRHLYKYLTEAAYDVKTLSRKGDTIDHKIDIGDADAWSQIDIDPDIVINCATILPRGIASDEGYVKNLFRTNCLGTYNLCKWAEKVISVKYILNISTLSVVSKPWPVPLREDSATYPSGPHALYSLSKLNQEIILNTFPFSHKVKVAHARLSALFGENMAWNGVMCSLIDKALGKEDIDIVNGTKVSADFIYIKDACRFITSLLKNEAEGIVNVASGVETSIFDLAKMILKIVGNEQLKINNVDTINGYSRALVDINKLNEITGGVHNTDIIEALKQTIKYRQTSS